MASLPDRLRRVPTATWTLTLAAALAGFVLALVLAPGPDDERLLVLNGDARPGKAHVTVTVRYDYRGEPGDVLELRIAILGPEGSDPGFRGVATRPDGFASGTSQLRVNVSSAPRVMRWIAEGRVEGDERILHRIDEYVVAPDIEPRRRP